MRKSRFTEEQIVSVLKEGEAGVTVAEILRRHGISRGTYFNWRAKYAGTTVAELPPANASPRLEPRAGWPSEALCASPQAEIRERCGTRLALVISHLEGRRHLPIIGLGEAA